MTMAMTLCGITHVTETGKGNGRLGFKFQGPCIIQKKSKDSDQFYTWISIQVEIYKVTTEQMKIRPLTSNLSKANG